MTHEDWIRRYADAFDVSATPEEVMGAIGYTRSYVEKVTAERDHLRKAIAKTQPRLREIAHAHARSAPALADEALELLDALEAARKLVMP